MTNFVLQGARAAAPYIANTAGQIALSYAASGISNLLNNNRAQGPRLESLQVQTSRDGASMPRIYGSARIAGQIIWASALKETSVEQTLSAGGKMGGSTRIENYNYSISFAVGLCEGEILGIGNIWANGELLLAGQYNYRLYKGTPDQSADPLIQMIDGPDTPAYRDTAYIVFEDFPIDAYGARLPQLNFEVFRQPESAGDRPRLESLVRGVDLIPGSGETVYAPNVREEDYAPGITRALNMNNLQGLADAQVAINQLQDQLPNCDSVTIVVSWFGDDLRCGECSLRPGVEAADRVMRDKPWSAGAVQRDAAWLISTIDDKPVYGGTPSDSSMIDLIRLLNARGIKTAIYPFILMDIPAEKKQAAFPWRGRISCSPESEDQTASASAQVASFFGTCQPSHFSSSGDSVTYSGPNEDSFRRMILHYAKLASVAGGVDSFIIGSEMRGLTTVRGLSHSYPAVSEFVSLASDVRNIVGASTKLTYAADWSEYFGHHKDGDVHFHLDPLWASPSIDAVGIDAYLPLSDWRSGEAHLDAQLAQGPHDLDYLTGNVEGGEGYDWYYANHDDRNAQIRTPITDGAQDKPWVYRFKDIRNWWSRPHYNRESGLELSTPTDWQPESKPIWLTEIGCPAVNKGANQPNVFYDPKSSESLLPYHSDGSRDDLMQRRYLEALIGYWEPKAGRNPISSHYSDYMIDPDHIHVWCWDARPYPDFPARQSIWSDGPNWRLGHWISGRVGTALLPDVVTDIVLSSGVGRPDVSALSGVVTGFTIERPMSARRALEPLALAYGFDMIEGPNGLSFVMQGENPLLDLSKSDLVFGSAAHALAHQRADPEARMQDVRLHYIDQSRDYQLAMVSVKDDAALTSNITHISAPMALGAAAAVNICARIFDRAVTGLETLSFTLAPNSLFITPGDVVSFSTIEQAPAGSWQVETMQGGASRRVSARRVTEAPHQSIDPSEPSAPALPAFASAAQIIVLDIPALTQERGGPLVGAYASPWNSTRLTTLGLGASDQVLEITSPAHIGVLLTDLPKGHMGRRDYGYSARIKLSGLPISSLTDDAFFAGGNAVALQTNLGWEVLQFQQAALIGADEYEISGFLRSQSGTQIFAQDLVPAGARLVWLGSGLETLTLAPSLRGQEIALSASTLGRADEQILTFTYSAAHLAPFAPVHAKAVQIGEEIIFTWLRQTRFGGDDWASLSVPLLEIDERYEVEFFNGETLLLTKQLTEPRCVLTAAERESNPHLSLGAMRVKIYQISSIIGRGAALEVAL